MQYINKLYVDNHLDNGHTNDNRHTSCRPQAILYN